MIYTHAAVAIVAAALAAWGGWSVQGWRLGEQISSMKAAQVVAVNNAIQGARVQEQARFKGVSDAQINASKRAAIARADADSASNELSRLRDTIRSTPGSVSGESATACYQRADKLSIVVAECSGALVSVARDVDAKASDVKTLLEAWPRN